MGLFLAAGLFGCGAAALAAKCRGEYTCENSVLEHGDEATACVRQLRATEAVTSRGC